MGLILLLLQKCLPHAPHSWYLEQQCTAVGTPTQGLKQAGCLDGLQEHESPSQAVVLICYSVLTKSVPFPHQPPHPGG